MTFPHRDPDLQPEEPKGPGCSGCTYAGWGVRLVPRCRHPERWCWAGPRLWPVLGAASPLAQWKVGCERKKAWGDGIPSPTPIPLAAWANTWHESQRTEQEEREAA